MNQTVNINFNISGNAANATANISNNVQLSNELKGVIYWLRNELLENIDKYLPYASFTISNLLKNKTSQYRERVPSQPERHRMSYARQGT